MKLTDEERNSHTLVCPMAEVWDQYDARRIGRIYFFGDITVGES